MPLMWQGWNWVPLASPVWPANQCCTRRLFCPSRSRIMTSTMLKPVTPRPPVCHCIPARHNWSGCTNFSTGKASGTHATDDQHRRSAWLAFVERSKWDAVDVGKLGELLLRGVQQVIASTRPPPVRGPRAQATFHRVVVNVVDRSFQGIWGVNVTIKAGAFLPITKAGLARSAGWHGCYSCARAWIGATGFASVAIQC